MTHQIRCPLRHHPHTAACYEHYVDQLSAEVTALKASLQIAETALAGIASMNSEANANDSESTYWYDLACGRRIAAILAWEKLTGLIWPAG